MIYQLLCLPRHLPNSSCTGVFPRPSHATSIGVSLLPTHNCIHCWGFYLPNFPRTGALYLPMYAHNYWGYSRPVLSHYAFLILGLIFPGTLITTGIILIQCYLTTGVSNLPSFTILLGHLFFPDHGAFILPILPIYPMYNTGPLFHPSHTYLQQNRVLTFYWGIYLPSFSTLIFKTYLQNLQGAP